LAKKAENETTSGTTPTLAPGGLKGAAFPEPVTRRPTVGLPDDVLPKAYDDPAKPGFGFNGGYGAVVFVAALVGLILSLTLDWIKRGGQVYDWSGWKNFFESPLGDFTYGLNLLYFSMAAYIGLMLVAILFVVLDFVPKMTVGKKHVWHIGAFGATAFFGFLLALSGSRVLGVFLQDAYQPGTTGTTLGIAVWVNLGLGVLVLGSAVYYLLGTLDYFTMTPSKGTYGERGVLLPALMAAIAAGALLTMPVPPFVAVDTASNTNYVSEYDLELFRFVDNVVPGGLAEGSAAAAPGHHLAFVHWSLWGVLFMALAATAAGLVERRGRDRARWGLWNQVGLLAGVSALVGTVFTVLLYVSIPNMATAPQSSSFSWNWIPAIAMLGLLGLTAMFVTTVTMPYLKYSASLQTTDEPETAST
jgi:hypothetical protein